MRRSIALLCVLLLGPAIQAHAQRPAKDPAAQLKSLMEERRDALQKAVNILNGYFQTGTVTLEVVVSAMTKSADAELELAKNKDERIAIYRKQVEFCRNVEKLCQARFDAGTVTEVDVLQAKAERLKVEIQLLREQGAGHSGK